MPDIDLSECVEITHFINPHALWLRKCNIDDREFQSIESELQQYAQCQYRKLSQHQYGKSPNQIERSDRVAVYFAAWKKWLRCDVDVIDAQGAQCILWAIDYGFPFQSSTKFIVLIEITKLAQKCSNLITKAAIDTIVPRNESTDGKHRMRRERWAPAAIDVLNKIKEEYDGFKFNLQSVQSGELHLGELFVLANNGQIRMVSQILIGMQLAKPVTDMNELLKSLEKTAKMDRWISNTNEIHSDCIWNHGAPEMSGACRLETVGTKTSHTSSAPVVSNCTRVSERPPCSSDRVEKYFESKRRNARIARKQSGVLENEWVAHQQKLNETIISSVEKRSKKQNDASVALPYTSLVKEKNPCSKSQNPTPAWPANGVDDQKLQNGTPIVANGMKSDEKAQPRRYAATKTTTIGEVKIQTNNAMTRMLVHSENLRVKPVNSIGEALFTSDIHTLIRNRYTETFKSQAYAWPHLMRGNSLILVDSKNRGKTVAYLPALCSRLQMNLDESSGMYNQSQLAMGPKAIILCANASTVENIAALCRWLMNRKETEVVHAIGSRNIRDVAAKLFNGCSIFVATTPCLLNLMKSHADVFSAQKLSFVVFDNIDMTVSRCAEDQLAMIFRKFCKQSDTQVVVTARTWHPILKNMRKRLLNPLLLIGNFLEAALYGKMNIQVQFNLEAAKLDFVYEHIKSLPTNTERLLIVCNDKIEAGELSAFLAAKDVELKCVVSIEPNMKKRMTHTIEQYWQNMDGLLICTDDALKDLRILNAQHIIHYSMPDSFNDFLFRFSSSIECYPNENAEPEEKMGRTSSLFCVDKKNKKQVPKLINLMERRGEIFTENVIEYCQNIRIENDEERAMECRLESICNFLFMHGRSNHESYCRERHLLMPEDVPQPTCEVPRSGSVRLKILNIVSPTRYSVQLLTTQQNDNRSWKPVNQADAFMDFITKFNLYYSEPNNHRDLLSVELDMLCAIENNNGPTHAYHRGRIIRIREKKSRCASDFDVDVRLIDVGTIVQRKSTALRQLADEFCHFPEQAVDLHLIGLVPADEEDEWDSEITQNLEKYLDEITLNKEDIHVQANIVFSLRKAIVVDCLRITQIVGCDCIILCSVKKHMKQKKLGISAMGTRRDIIKMAESIGIKVKCRIDGQSQEERSLNDSLPESNGNTSVKNCATSIEPDLAASPSQEADKKSVNLMEFSPVASQTSSRLSLTVDTPTKQILTTTDAPNENWIILPSSESVDCVITSYHSPDDFFINIEDDALGLLLGDIDRYVEQYDGIDTSMEMPDIGNYCLAKVDGKYNRAKILSNYCNNGIFYARVFCCDIGSIEDCEIENVMSIPDSFRTLPFQAIWCRLYGIKPIESLNSGWLEKASDQIWDEVIDPILDLTVKMISAHEMTPLVSDSPFTMEKINVVLMSSNCKVNRLVVNRGLAEFERDAERVIDSCNATNESNVIDSDDDEAEEDWDQEWKEAGIVRQPPAQHTLNDESEAVRKLLNDLTEGSMDVGFDADDCLQFMDDQTRAIYQEYKAIEAEHTNLDMHEGEKQEEEPKIFRSDSTSDSDNCAEMTSNQRPIGMLQYKYKVPYVTWQQSDELIMLSIKADENVAYNLDITSDRLIFNGEIREETNLLVLHFFGAIDPEHTSHEIRGLNVVVRLVKTVPDWPWPYLTSEHKKFNWLSYDYNAIKPDDIYIPIKSHNNGDDDEDVEIESPDDDYESNSEDDGMDM